MAPFEESAQAGALKDPPLPAEPSDCKRPVHPQKHMPDRNNNKT
jgi:hypothetical protein